MSDRHVFMGVLFGFGAMFIVISIITSALSAEQTRKKDASAAYRLSVASSVTGVLGLLLVAISAAVMLMDYTGLFDKMKKGMKAESVLDKFVEEQIQKSTCTQPVMLKELLDMQRSAGGPGLCPK